MRLDELQELMIHVDLTNIIYRHLLQRKYYVWVHYDDSNNIDSHIYVNSKNVHLNKRFSLSLTVTIQITGIQAYYENLMYTEQRSNQYNPLIIDEILSKSDVDDRFHNPDGEQLESDNVDIYDNLPYIMLENFQDVGYHV